jgi:putative redox protein
MLFSTTLNNDAENKMSQVNASLKTGLQVEISNGRHEWLADEPVDVGGTDTGPNPYELLLGGLAACICVTIAMYCRHKGLTLNSIDASFRFSRIHADDCEHCEDDATGFLDHIESNVHIDGEFDESQKKRLSQIATRCPVHKTLANGVEFKDNATFA